MNYVKLFVDIVKRNKKIIKTQLNMITSVVFVV